MKNDFEVERWMLKEASSEMCLQEVTKAEEVHISDASRKSFVGGV